MAKQTLNTALDEFSAPHFADLWGSVFIVERGRSFATFSNGDGREFTLEGSAFKYKGGNLISGKVESAHFTTEDDYFTSDITEIGFNIKQLPKHDFTPSKLVAFLLKGADEIQGSDGKDYLIGYNGNDVISGGKGEDILAGRAGLDTLTGGADFDQFYIYAREKGDVITDFHFDGVRDQIVLLGASDYDAVQSGDDVLITTDAGSNVRILDFQLADLADGDVRLL